MADFGRGMAYFIRKLCHFLLPPGDAVVMLTVSYTMVADLTAAHFAPRSFSLIIQKWAP
jgi:histidinol-phosphate/aromatic aminotransferase/cobyric acid decarboxylase-like protein